MKLPKMPSLDEINVEAKDENELKYEAKPEPQGSGFSLPDLDDLEPIKTSKVSDDFDQVDDWRIIDEDEDDLNEELEAEIDADITPFSAILPPVDGGELELDELEEVEEIQDFEAHGEDDELDEKAKEFFRNLKSKIFGKNKVKKPGESKGKIKKQRSIIPIVVSIILGVIVIALLLFTKLGFKPLNELSIKGKSDDIAVIVNNIQNDELLQAEVTNDSETSAEFTLKLTLKENKGFMGVKHECYSDIIVLETDESTTEFFDCNIPDGKYKGSIEIEALD